jgi:hypothetical protein
MGRSCIGSGERGGARAYAVSMPSSAIAAIAT